MSIIYLPLYPVFLLASWLTAFVPPRVGHAAAWALASVTYWLLPNRRKVMGANFAPVLGKSPDDPEVKRLGRLSFRGFARYLYEFLSFPHRTIEQMDARVSLHVGDDFMHARAQGKGMIFVSAHFGNMDYAAVAMARRVVPMTIVADMLKPKRLMDHLVEFRSKKGLNVVYLAKAPRAILRALKNNEAVGFLVDVGCNRNDGIPVTFFGRRTKFSAGPALLALRTAAPIVVGYALVVGDRIEVHSYPPIYAVPTGNKAEDARRCSQMIANYFEDFIGRYPEQWYIYRPMWGPETQCSSPADEQIWQEPAIDAV